MIDAKQEMNSNGCLVVMHFKIEPAYFND